MTLDQLESFFIDEGTLAEVKIVDDNAVAQFKVRGVPYKAVSFADGSRLFQISCEYNTPESTTIDTLRDAIAKTEVEYPIVHIRIGHNDEKLAFQIYGEQIEPKIRFGDIFWPLLDIITIAGDSCYATLSGVPEKIEVQDTSGNFGENLEKGLRAGCRPAVETSADKHTATHAVVAKVTASLALLADTTSTASAFCFHSNKTKSFYLTNAHAVGNLDSITLYKQWPTFAKFQATVVAKGEGKHEDLAILAIPSGDEQCLELDLGTPDEGSPVALAGYPRVQFDIADEYGELVPSFHQGTVSALIDRGAIVLHDALSRPGNSGGPLFDPSTGRVIGVVQGGFESDGEFVAIGVARTVLPFLEKLDIGLIAKRKKRPRKFSTTEGDGPAAA